LLRIEVRPYLLTTDEGGRTAPWRAWAWPFDFGLKDESGMPFHNDCWVDLGDDQLMAPGEERIAVIRPLFPEYLVGKLRAGDSFTVIEGPRTMGRGSILRFLEGDSAPVVEP
jgi:hypothetical protein